MSGAGLVLQDVDLLVAVRAGRHRLGGRHEGEARGGGGGRGLLLLRRRRRHRRDRGRERAGAGPGAGRRERRAAAAGGPRAHGGGVHEHPRRVPLAKEVVLMEVTWGVPLQRHRVGGEGVAIAWDESMAEASGKRDSEARDGREEEETRTHYSLRRHPEEEARSAEGHRERKRYISSQDAPLLVCVVREAFLSLHPPERSAETELPSTDECALQYVMLCWDYKPPE